jgi:hypothetical protein
MAEQKETIILEFDVDESDAVESINSLTKANKELRAERNALNLQSEQGKKRATEINALLDQNTNKIKTNVSALEKQKINIGNYKSALDGVHPALGKVGEGLEAGASGFMAMARSALAFIATPIGAILAGLVAVFTLLKSALSTNNELLDKFENITTAIGSVVDVVVVRLGKLGEALVALFSGEFEKAADLTGEAFNGLAAEIGSAVAEGQKFLQMAREVEDAQRALTLQTARQENVIKQLVVASKNRNLSLDEQEDKLRKALALEEELVDARIALAEKDLETTAKTLAAKQGMYIKEGESVEKFVNRILKDTKSLDSLVDPVIEKVVALEDARGSSLAFQEKLENSLAAIQEKRTKILEDQTKALAEQAAEQRAIERANQRRIRGSETEDPLVGAFQTQANLIDNIDDKLKKDLAKRNEEFNAEQIKQAEATAAAKARVEMQGLDVTADVLGAAAGLFEQNTKEYKALATAQTLIDTFVGAQRAFNALAGIVPAGPILGAAAAAAAVIAGLGRVAAINNVQFANGGWTGSGGKYEPAGIVHKGEVVWSQADVARVGGPSIANAMRPTSTQSYNGRFFDGGYVAGSLSSPLDQQLALANIIKNLPPGEVSVVEINKGQRRVKVKEQISKR